MSHYKNKINSSGLTIYDPITILDEFWIPDSELQNILQIALNGISLDGMPPRTRSKFTKEIICKALGYPIPISFQKTKPRFVCQNFDVYIQKSNNLQIWNEEISPERRYVIIQVVDDRIAKVRVINGAELSQYDKTGTLTIKHQAIFVPNSSNAELLSEDTSNIKNLLKANPIILNSDSPTALPTKENLLSIKDVFAKLKTIMGTRIKDSGFDQDRNRGAELHRSICKHLGYSNYQDNGQFPDILHQLIEVKLQTSPTIDLGQILPSSDLPLRNVMMDNMSIRHRDIRYALFYGIIENGEVLITNFCLTSGEKFFNRFPQMRGKIVNKKIQLPLPKDFFNL